MVSVSLLALCCLGFVSLGLPDGILGAAWPVIRHDLDLRLDAAGPLMLLATCGAVVSSALSGRLLARLSTAAVLVTSTCLAALALVGFALAQSWQSMMGASLVAGLGGGAVDASLNNFVARHHNVRQMNWLHGCWGVGATLGPVTLAAMLAARVSWRGTYLLLAVLEATLALAFLVSARRWPRPGRGEARPARPGPVAAGIGTRLAFFFLYAGIESSAGLWGATFLIETKGATPALASAVVGSYWGGLMVGRFVLGALTAAIGPARLVRGSVRAALVALVVLALPQTPLPVAAAALAAVGLGFAAVYPTVMHETPLLFGENASTHLVGYQVAAASAGIATVPWLVGLAARRSTPAIIPVVLAVLATGLVFLEARRRRA